MNKKITNIFYLFTLICFLTDGYHMNIIYSPILTCSKYMKGGFL